MNGLGGSIVLLVAQATGLMLLIALLVRWAERRGPGTAAFAGVVGLAGLLVLPLLAAVDWPTLPTPAPPVVVTEGHPDEVAGPATETAPNAGGLPVADIVAAMRRVAKPAVGMVEPAAPAAPVVGWVWVVGATVGGLYLLLGAIAVGRCVVSSRRIDDPEAAADLAEMAVAVGARCRARLRETDAIASPATAGWLWPVILLPAGWREWDRGQRRAVFAHELAHIVRRDFLAMLLGRLTVAVYFFHPLAHWLFHRLRLDQELAADALGASAAGGRGEYLRCLAGVALAQPAQVRGWPAPGLFGPFQTWKRRVAMLQDATRSAEKPAGWRRIAVAATVLAAVLGLSAASGLTAAGPPVVGGGGQVVAELAGQYPAFDLTNLPPGGVGVIGFRPTEMATKPGVAELFQLVDKMIPLMFARTNMTVPDAAPGPGLAGLDQILLTIDISTEKAPTEHKEGGKEEPTVRSGMMHSGAVLRTARPFDWATTRGRWMPKAKSAEHAGRTYHFIPESVNGVGPMVVFVADDRTLVVAKEAAVRKLIDRLAAGAPAPKPAGWERVERSEIALAYDSTDRGWLERRKALKKSNSPDDDQIEAFVNNTKSLVADLNTREKTRGRLFVCCETAEQAAAIFDWLRVGHQTFQAELTKAEKEGSADLAKEPEPVRQFALLQKHFLRSAHAEVVGTEVRGTIEAPGDAVQLYIQMMGAMAAEAPPAPKK